VQWIAQLDNARVVRGDKSILDNVTLSFLPGAKIGVVGPNGAGMSTALQVIAGLEQPSNGEARLAPNASVGLLAQEPMPHLVPLVFVVTSTGVPTAPPTPLAAPKPSPKWCHRTPGWAIRRLIGRNHEGAAHATRHFHPR
jgi:energy-coupling factor transporter ATP-binding protein EcfA2